MNGLQIYLGGGKTNVGSVYRTFDTYSYKSNNTIFTKNYPGGIADWQGMVGMGYAFMYKSLYVEPLISFSYSNRSLRGEWEETTEIVEILEFLEFINYKGLDKLLYGIGINMGYTYNDFLFYGNVGMKISKKPKEFDLETNYLASYGDHNDTYESLILLNNIGLS